MPPKKKPRLSSRPPSTTPQVDSLHTSATTPASTESAAKPDADYDLVTDPWTDEQETALLKGIIKWKPVGMHKHFRMIAISEFMKSQGYAPSNAEHTRIPGIWKKLGTLYNLPALDEREDSLITDPTDDPEVSKELYCPFELPEDEYGEMMFERRLAMEGSTSPVTSGLADSRRGSTVADTDELASSPAPSRGRKPNRSTRARGKRSTRLQVEIEAPRKGSDIDPDSEDGEEGDEEGTDAGKEDSDGDEEAEEETGGSPTTRGRPRRSRSKQKDKKGPGTRRTGRRR